MKVLFQIRPGYKDGPSGDSMQMLKTMTALKDVGVDVYVSSSQNIDLTQYDLIHIFNCTRVTEAHGFYKNAANQKKKVVISPIFVDMHNYYKSSSSRLAAWRAENILRREILQGSNMILVNSKKEFDWINKTLMISTPWKIIYHGADQAFALGDKEWFKSKYGLEDFILCVGRLSPIKNQLTMIKAVKNLGLPIVLVGPVNNKDYAVACAEESDGYIKYIPYLNHTELASAYKAAKVHVQPSWFETVGLASLEAGAAGIPVVITREGGGREYFGDLAEYVDPGYLDSIRNGVLESIKNRNNDELQKHILNNFTWEKSAKDTLEAYQQVLDTENSSRHDLNAFYSQSYKI